MRSVFQHFTFQTEQTPQTACIFKTNFSYNIFLSFFRLRFFRPLLMNSFLNDFWRFATIINQVKTIDYQVSIRSLYCLKFAFALRSSTENGPTSSVFPYFRCGNFDIKNLKRIKKESVQRSQKNALKSSSKYFNVNELQSIYCFYSILSITQIETVKKWAKQDFYNLQDPNIYKLLVRRKYFYSQQKHHSFLSNLECKIQSK